MGQYKCEVCKRQLRADEAYEYHDRVACAEHFDTLQVWVDADRNLAHIREKHETEKYRGLDFSDSPIGKVNRSIFGRK